MDISNNSPILVAMSREEDRYIFKTVLEANGFTNIKVLSSIDESYQYATRNHFDLLIIGLQLEQIPGSILMQKLRASGNYGLEPFWFVGKKVSQEDFGILAEYDVQYVLTYPISTAKIEEKLQYLLKHENNLSEVEKAYRQARSFEFRMFGHRDFKTVDQILDLPGKWEVLCGRLSGKERSIAHWFVTKNQWRTTQSFITNTRSPNTHAPF